MRFIGKKDKLLDRIHTTLDDYGVTDGSMTDLFAGTGAVALSYKQRGFTVTTCDLLYFCYLLHRAQVYAGKEPAFTKLRREQGLATGDAGPLQAVIDHLNALPDLDNPGFIWRHYTVDGTAADAQQRQYFTPANGHRIDTIRRTIDLYRDRGLLSQLEFEILVASVIASVPFYANVSGVYAAYLKSYDPRALKPFQLRPVELVPGRTGNRCFNADGTTILDQVPAQLLYLDPPYNGRQYGSNYHLLETIARYDNPAITGVTGLRDTSSQRSDFCSKRLALPALDRVAANGRYETLALSYNSEGIMATADILATLGQYGTVALHEFDYARFKSNSGGLAATKRVVQEQLFVLRRQPA